MKSMTNLSAPVSYMYICAFCDCCNEILADAIKGFGLAQIFPMTDDATGAEPKVVSADFSDPYVLLIRDDSSVMVLRADESGDLDEVEQGEAMREDKWVSGSLYEDSNDVLRLETGDDSEDEAGNVLMFLLSGGGGLQVGSISRRRPIQIGLNLVLIGIDFSSAKSEKGSIHCRRAQLPSFILVHRIHGSPFNGQGEFEGDFVGRAWGCYAQVTLSDRKSIPATS